MADGGGPLAYLSVARSLTGRAWRQRAADPHVVRGHQQALGLSEPLSRALAARGVGLDAGHRFLSPSLRDEFPDPSTFAGMELAAETIVDAVVAGRQVYVFADYDVDGASSAALLVRWFRAMGSTLPIYVPDRVLEGYGPSEAAFRGIKAAGAELVITVDCGAAAFDALEAAHAMGLRVVVIDHHLMRAEQPRCAALVNPNRHDCGSGQGNLAAAGVTFVLLAALNREARRRGLFASRPEPDLRRWLDLAALGAICDVTQLTGFNRVLAARGLQVLASAGNPGVAALMEVAGVAPDSDGVFTAGFVLGPRINAGGRIGRSDLGARLLSTDDPDEARRLAAELDALNRDRKDVERDVAEAAVARIEASGPLDPETPVILVAGEGWHPGVIGIVAGRLRERWRRPTLVIGVDPVTGIGKGSGRSQPGVNLGRAVQAAFDEGLLLSGGGHAMAAGLTVRAGQIEALGAFLTDFLALETSRALEADVLEIDALVTPSGADQALWSEFQNLKPFGPGNPEPVVALADVRLVGGRALKGGHVRCSLCDPAGRAIDAIAWRCADTPMGARLLSGAGAIHAAGRLKRDTWNGRDRIQLELEDIGDPRLSQ